MEDSGLYTAGGAGVGLISLLSGMLTWSLKRNIRNHDTEIEDMKKRHEKEIAEVKLETARVNSKLVEHQLEVAQSYAKLPSIDRLHDRMDDMAKDIKTILSRGVK